MTRRKKIDEREREEEKGNRTFQLKQVGYVGVPTHTHLSGERGREEKENVHKVCVER